MNGIELLNDKLYKSMCRKIAYNNSLADDLYQETVLKIMEKGYNLHTLNEVKKLPHFFYTFARYTFKSDTFKKHIYGHKAIRSNDYSSFNDNYTSTYVLTDSIDNEDKLYKEAKAIENIEYNINCESSSNTDEYRRLMFIKYVEYGSTYKLSEATGINVKTIQLAVKTYKNKLKAIYEATYQSK